MTNHSPQLYDKHKISFNAFPDDGLSVVAAEPWFKVKVQVIQQYLQSFVAQAAGSVDEIIFVDLFAGSGLYCSGYQREIFAAPSLACLSLGLPISRWIFCESEPEAFSVLKVRVNKYFRDQNVLLQEGKQRDMLDKFRYYIPPSKGGHKVASLCLIDPFSFDIEFDFIEKLAAMGFSFIIPYTFPLNEKVNHTFYLDTQRSKLTSYLRNLDALKDIQSNASFYKRLVQTHQRNMLSLGLHVSVSHHKLESRMMDVPTYAMGFFSKQFLAKAIQKDIQTTTSQQFQLFS